jgi:hypothetical protein
MVRLWTWLALGTAGLLMALSFPVFPRDLQAWGNNFVATVIVAGTLAWHLLHPVKPDDVAGSAPPAELTSSS